MSRQRLALDEDRETGLTERSGDGDCDSKLSQVFWVRQSAPGIFEETLIAEDMSAPVHIDPIDFDQDGDLDLLVACMSFIFPNNDPIGAIIALENQGDERFRKRVLLDQVARVSDVRAADLNGDGLLDLAVGQFGYDQGEIRWMKQTAPWQSDSEILLSLSGAINVCIEDFNGDDTPDIAAIVSQQWEEIHLFENDGKGNFSSHVLLGLNQRRLRVGKYDCLRSESRQSTGSALQQWGRIRPYPQSRPETLARGPVAREPRRGTVRVSKNRRPARSLQPPSCRFGRRRRPRCCRSQQLQRLVSPSIRIPRLVRAPRFGRIQASYSREHAHSAPGPGCGRLHAR